MKGVASTVETEGVSQKLRHDSLSSLEGVSRQQRQKNVKVQILFRSSGGYTYRLMHLVLLENTCKNNYPSKLLVETKDHFAGVLSLLLGRA